MSPLVPRGLGLRREAAAVRLGVEMDPLPPAAAVPLVLGQVPRPPAPAVQRVDSPARIARPAREEDRARLKRAGNNKLVLDPLAPRAEIPAEASRLPPKMLRRKPAILPPTPTRPMEAAPPPARRVAGPQAWNSREGSRPTSLRKTVSRWQCRNPSILSPPRRSAIVPLRRRGRPDPSPIEIG